MKEIRKQEKYREILARLFLFEGIGKLPVQEAFLSPECCCCEFEAGEKIYTRHSFQKSLGVVLSGELKAFKRAPDGSSLLLNTFFTGGVFGVAGLFHNSKEYVSEVAAVRRSRVLFLPQHLLQALFRLDPRIAENYIGYLSSRICFLNSRIDNFTGGTAESRLAGFLLTLSAQCNGEKKLLLPVSFTELAASLDIGRASLYRAIHALTESGAIARQGREITITDYDRLSPGQYS